jgi:DNA gyrase/topoisomerase IV subunit A
MSEEKRKKKEEDVDQLKEVLGVVSREVPGLIKGIIGSVFSEEAGRDMGKAAAAFYKQLKDAGMPEETAVKMTENYISVFTSLGDVMKNAVSGKRELKGEEIGEEISNKIKEKLAEKHVQKKGEEEEEDGDEDED